MTELVFRDPPPPKKPRRDWAGIAEKLKAHPGQWAVMASGAKRPTMAMIATRIERGEFVAFRPAGAFESVTRESPLVPGQYEVYARWVGYRDGLS